MPAMIARVVSREHGRGKMAVDKRTSDDLDREVEEGFDKLRKKYEEEGGEPDEATVVMHVTKMLIDILTRLQSDDYEPIRRWYRLVRADEVQYLRLTERIVSVYEQAGYTVETVETLSEVE